MTICNMSIEAGAKAGLIAPDQTTFDFLQGRPHAPQGADWDAAVEYWTTLRTDEDAVFDREVHIDAAALTPYVTWGTNPGQGLPIDGAVPDPADFADEGERARRRAGAGLHGPDRRHAAARDQGRHRLPRLLHQRPDRGPPGRRRAAARQARSTPTPGCSSSPGRWRVKAQAEAEGLDRVFLDAGAEWRGAGLLDVPGHEPRPAQAGGAVGLHQQPQLPGPAGQGRAHPPRVARPSPPRPRSPGSSPPPPTSRTLESDPMDAFTTHTGTAAPLRRSERRHRPDHPGRVPQADHPHRLRGRPVRRLADQRARLRAQPAAVRRRLDPRRRPRLRHRLLPRARRAGRCWTAASGSSSAPGSPTSSGTTRPSPACSPCCCRRPTSRRCGRRSRPTRRPQVTVDLQAKQVTYGDVDGAVRDRRLHPLAAARGARRRRPDRAEPARHRGVRGGAAGLAAEGAARHLSDGASGSGSKSR